MSKKIPNITIILSVIIIIVIIITIILFLKRSHYEKDISSEEKFDKYTVKAVVYKAATVIDGKYQKIPKTIIQTNENAKIPINMFATIKGLLDTNPEYEYKYYDDAAVKNFMRTEYSPRIFRAYNDLIPGAYRADFFRYCYLYKYGGVYIDTGMVAIRPLRNLISESDEFIAPEDDGNKFIYNAFICSVPGHPIIGNAIELCLQNIENKDLCDDPLDITGPGALGNVFRKTLNQKVKPNRDYGNGIKIIQYQSGKTLYGDPKNIVGEINTNGIVIMKTKYPTYYLDGLWYHSQERYGELWNRGEVYYSTIL